MSQLEDKIFLLIKDAYPYFDEGRDITREYTVNFKGQVLRFDYYIKPLSIFVEGQGSQHYKYVPFFHKNPRGFVESKRRDNLKKEYALSLHPPHGIVEIDEDEIDGISSDQFSQKCFNSLFDVFVGDTNDKA